MSLGVLGWSPEQFWRATPYESSCAYVGWCKANNAGPWHRDLSEPDPEYIADWRATIAALKEQHPDVPRKRKKRDG